MAITTTQGYLGNRNLKPANIPISFTSYQVTEYIKCFNDPVYFIENYVKIVHVDRGLVPFKMYDYQKKMVESFQNNRFTICRLSRQSGKSVTVVSYFLYYILFNPTVTVAILANKDVTAKKLLGQLKKSYELLPKWMQHGIIEWNKNSIELENGSKIIASATSSSAIRGESCITGEAIVTIEVDGVEFDVTLRELHEMLNKEKQLHPSKVSGNEQIRELVQSTDGAV